MERVSLELEVQSNGVRDASDDLDTFINMAIKAETSARDLGDGSTSTSRDLRTLATQTSRTSRETDNLGDEINRSNGLLGRFSRSTRGLRSGVSRLGSRFSSLASNFRRSSSSILEGLMGIRLGVIGVAAGIAGAALAAPFIVLARVVGVASERIRELNSRAIGLNIDTTQLQGFVQAGRSLGIESDTVFETINTLNERIGQFRSGLTDLEEPTIRIVRQLGLTEEEIRTLGSAELYSRVIDGLSNVGDATSRTAAAMEIFGDDGKNALLLIEQGSDGLLAAQQRIQDLGIGISPEDAQSVADMSTSVGTLRTIFEAFGNVLTAEIAPGITSIANEIADFIIESGGVRNIVTENFGFVLDIVNTIQRAVEDGTFRSIINDWATVAQNFSDSAGLAFQGFSTTFQQVFGVDVVEGFRIFSGGLATATVLVNDVIQKIILSVDVGARTIGTAFGLLASGVVTTIRNMFNNVSDVFDDIQRLARTTAGIIRGVVETITNPIDSFRNGVSDSLTTSVREFRSAAREVNTSITNTTNTLGTDLVNTVTDTGSAISQIGREGAAAFDQITQNTQTAMDRISGVEDVNNSFNDSLRETNDLLEGRNSSSRISTNIELDLRDPEEIAANNPQNPQAPAAPVATPITPLAQSVLPGSPDGDLTSFNVFGEPNNGSEEDGMEALAERLAERNALILDSDQTLGAGRCAISAEVSDQLRSKEQEASEAQLQNASESFGALESLASAFGRRGARVAQTAAIAQATIDAYSGFSRALATNEPLPFGARIALATTTLATGLSNVARIRSAGNFANGGIIPGVATAGDTLTANVNAGEMILNQDQQQNLFNRLNNNSNSGAVAPNVTIINNSGVNLESEQVTTEGGDVELIVRRAADLAKSEIARDIRSGEGDIAPTLEDTFTNLRRT